ncbi:MAG: hypothetical protein K9N49_06900 [Candidatus Marinimicrobia bacterium]|nr:hypothetical protein [Candidatus Neomarinimicrobiota bacterium]
MTLMEVMVVTAISGVLIAGIISGILTANRLNYAHAQRVAAFSVALERLERIRATPFQELASDHPDFGWTWTNITHMGGANQVPLNGWVNSNLRRREHPTRFDVANWVFWWIPRRGWQVERIDGVIYPPG